MRRLKLVVFDIDGTLIQVPSSWQYLHKRLGTWDRGREYAERFFKGLITYEMWARLDASLWKGLPFDRIRQMILDIPYTEGAQEVVTTLRKEGLKVALISAGLNILAQRIEEEIGVDCYLANDLMVKNGFLTGEVKVNVSFHNKDKALESILQGFHLAMEECAAVGDDETLIPLFRRVGLAIAFNPRGEKVEKQAHNVVRGKDLRPILPYLLAGKT